MVADSYMTLSQHRLTKSKREVNLVFMCSCLFMPIMCMDMLQISETNRFT
jgi:hypothetical protein